jgi:hypothetical protein
VKFDDYSPPTSPSLDHQRDALKKGLGRALQWALTGRLDAEALLEACLRDQRFDGQIEDPRGGWLWQMVRSVGATERFRVPILHALYDLADAGSETQLCQIARRYAEAGDETFRARLYQIVEQKPVADSPWLGEAEILTLDGEQAFLFAARVRGRFLEGRGWEWDDGSLIDLAAERFGEEHVNRLLDASSDGAVSRFRESWRQEKQNKPEQHDHHHSHKERMAAISVQEIFRAAEGDSKCFWFRGWGMHADHADLVAVLHRLWLVHEPGVIANLLRVFSAHALPEFDARLLKLCHHDDEVRRRAFAALAQNTHQLVREFALTELRKGFGDGSVVALFINNFSQGDEHRILEVMELPDDECELHWLLMDVIKLLENHPEADCSRLGVISYASTPCENCRFYAARHLLNQHAAPGWLKEECQFDSGEDCRKLVSSPNGSTEAR